MIRRRLVVMLKEPIAGRVKTRLAAGIGVAAATRFYRQTTAAVLARVSRSERAVPARQVNARARRDHGLAEWETVLAVTPDAAVGSRAWSPSLPRVGQGSGDLGRRMQHIMDQRWVGPVVIVGSDIPGIRRAHIRTAFEVLGSCDAVFGSAPDGGYWLVGLKRFPRVPRAFDSVRWSTAHALADTRDNLAALEVGEVAMLQDVDEAGDLARAGSPCPPLRV